MKIGILGTGDVGQTLGADLIKKGHEVKLGSRDANNEKVKKWVSENGANASGGTFEDAVKFGELVILATLWPGTENAIKLAKLENFKGKLIIDATNPLTTTPTGIALEVGHTNSGGEIVQGWIPEAHVVKAFNIVGNKHMVDPKFEGGPPDMWIAGNHDESKKKVTAFLQSIGWEVIDAGGISASRLLEPLCILWVNYGVKTGTWNHAFKLLRK